MYLTEELQKKWAPVLEHEGLESIKDPYKKAVTALGDMSVASNLPIIKAYSMRD